MPDDALVHYEVEPNYSGWTLADYVLEKLKRPLSPERLERLLRSRALVHSEPELLPQTQIWPGLKFALRKRSPGDAGEPAPLKIVFEDEALLVVDKPAGLALHPTARYHVTTLTWALENRHRNAAGEKPDPAHRLDRETSGLVACGRNSIFTKSLKGQFAARLVDKTYLALVEGSPADDAFAIDFPLVVGGGRIKVKVLVHPDGARAVTQVEVLQRFVDREEARLSLLRCTPLTGRQHQIRAHLHAAGFPIVGDKLYGPSEEIFLRLAESGGSPAPPGHFDDAITTEEKKRLRLPRQALHAATLGLTHPLTAQKMRFESPLPDDVAELIRQLSPAHP
jgi:23S rRNA pseudouridine1911/1915/1917 synthase